ncbi:serine O-acetyltransferase [Lentisphaera marina]|uniref:serine O-acetyltransferase n=1 Tax=Lentisphaera marina TaxID=1111041 RepID=UPI00236671E4|nr:serine O-acetyltransferase [Lentisphaera marina]MDD7984455.1 serine O-acetyltransferase [Lentisphaera marina]
MNSKFWQEILNQAEVVKTKEQSLARLIDEAILSKASVAEVLTSRLAESLGEKYVTASDLEQIFTKLYLEDASLAKAAKKDLKAICDRDPACNCYVIPMLYYKGFQALQASRLAHVLWKNGRAHLACHIQSRNAEVFGVDIHPGARFGTGILLDHASSFVAGETAVVGNDVSILHEVTLGGSGKDCGDRHPKVGDGVLIGAGAKLLGNISIGAGAKIGAGSVVLDDVQSHTTVVGVPARPVGKPLHQNPSKYMDHHVK